MINSLKNNQISFKSYIRTVHKNNSYHVKYRNDTSMFRDDLDWNVIFDLIAKDKPKIYCYACSDGSEPYSIALGLTRRMGQNFSIIARDIDNVIINHAKDKLINLSKSDIYKILRYTGDFGTSCFTKANKRSNIEDTEIFRVNNNLYNCVDFNIGDFTKDINSIDCNNSIIFFRNVWPYLGFHNMHKLIKKMTSKFCKNTKLVIGDYDRYSLFLNRKRENILFNYGFKEISYNIFQRND